MTAQRTALLHHKPCITNPASQNLHDKPEAKLGKPGHKAAYPSPRGGRAFGATDEFGVQASEMRIDAHDLNATILRMMGMDHKKLTFFYQGRDMRLTDVKGEGEFSAKLLA
jgi:hypothetical protein